MVGSGGLFFDPRVADAQDSLGRVENLIQAVDDFSGGIAKLLLRDFFGDGPQDKEQKSGADQHDRARCQDDHPDAQAVAQGNACLSVICHYRPVTLVLREVPLRRCMRCLSIGG